MTSAPTGEGTITTAARPLAPGGIVRMQHTLAVVILVAFALIAWHDRSATGLRGSDELEYRGLAESIEHGTYREIYEFNAPLGAKYPPAFPAWLVMVRKVAGDRLDAVRVGNLVLVTAMLAILYWSCVSVAG